MYQWTTLNTQWKYLDICVRYKSSLSVMKVITRHGHIVKLCPVWNDWTLSWQQLSFCQNSTLNLLQHLNTGQTYQIRDLLFIAQVYFSLLNRWSCFFLLLRGAWFKFVQVFCKKKWTIHKIMTKQKCIQSNSSVTDKSNVVHSQNIKLWLLIIMKLRFRRRWYLSESLTRVITYIKMSVKIISLSFC